MELLELIYLIPAIPLISVLAYKIYQKLNPDYDLIPKTLLDQLTDVCHYSSEEIKKIFKLFCILSMNENCCELLEDEIDKVNFERFEMEKYNESFRLPKEVFRHVKDLKYNPFLEELLRVFSTKSNPQGSNSVSFYDFLNLLNSLHIHACPELKASTAFKMFDYDKDGIITKYDCEEMIKRLTKGQLVETEPEKGEEKIKKLAENLMLELDIDMSGNIDLQEFRHSMSRNLVFLNNFKLRFSFK